MRANYEAQLVAWLGRYKRYPSRARRLGEEGTAVVRFEVAPDGRVLRAVIHESSGYDSLDDAALRMVERASPVPSPPPGYAAGTAVLSVPVGFRLHD